MRLLAVIAGEFIGADERRDWATLDALVAASASDSPIEVRVMALVNDPGPSIVFGHPLGRAVGGWADWTGRGTTTMPGLYDPAESARQRLDRSLQHLRRLGLRARGDIEPGNAYRAVRREVARGVYDRVLLLLPDRGSPRRRLAIGFLATRLRRSLDIPVDVPGRPDLTPPKL